MTLDFTSFGAAADSGRDAAPAARAALARLRELGGGRLVLPPGRYDFWPERAAERWAFIANNDEGLKRIAFAIVDLPECEIDGEGAVLVFHGRIIPFLIEKSRRVRLKGMAIDWHRPFHCEAEIIGAHRLGLDLRIPDAHPYRLETGRLVFEGESGATHDVGNALEWDPRRHETAAGAADNYGLGARCVAEAIGPRELRLTARFNPPVPRVGNRLVLVDERRDCPAIVIASSALVTLSDVAIHHAGAMGVIAQRSETLRLERVRVAPRQGGGRLVSTQNDATHFVQCRGTLELIDCLFENQMDDATNVHGVYAQVTERIRPDAVELRLMHRQQHGLEFVAAGERLQFARAGSLETIGEIGVRAVQRVNKEFMRVTFEGAPRIQPEAGDVATNLSWVPEVTIRGCTARANRARGFLLSTPGPIRVEANRFHVPGTAIMIAGDAREWFEAGPVSDVAIRGNHFEDCGYGVWGRAAIEIGPAIPEELRAGLRYHRNIVIADNSFVAFDRRLVRAHCVEGLTVCSNSLAPSSAYEAAVAGEVEPVTAEHCSELAIEQPILA